MTYAGSDDARRAGTERPALRRCTGVDASAFGNEYWGRRPLASRDSTGRDFADLLVLDDVDELLSRRGLRTPFVRVVKDGRVLDATRFTGSGGVGAEVGDQVVADRLLPLIVDGSTIVLQGLHRVWPPLIDFAGQLAADLGHPVQVNAYVTPPSSTGFSTHYDTHDVFVLQVAGEKRWRVHEPVHRAPLPTQPWTDHREAVERRSAEPPLLDTVLRTGDVLYLPRGYLHAATSLGSVSAHLTVGVHPVTRYDVVQAALTTAADNAEFRASLPVGFAADDAVAADEAADILRALAKELDGVDPAAIAATVRSRSRASTRPAPVAPFAQAAAVAGLTPETVVRRRPHLQYTIDSAADRVVLRLPDKTISFPASTRAAVHRALDGGPVAAKDLPGLAPDEQLVVVRRLLREAVVVPAE